MNTITLTTEQAEKIKSALYLGCIACNALSFFHARDKSEDGEQQCQRIIAAIESAIDVLR